MKGAAWTYNQFPVAIGDRFARLVVVERLDVAGRTKWKCRCDCGAEALAFGHQLHNESKRSCGCLQREIAKKTALSLATHGHAGRKTPTYVTWRSMLNRCQSDCSNGYENYGGRGIAVCDRWRSSFENFLADMGERPAGMTIDRIDTNGNYEPGNCRWATDTVQRKNKRPRRSRIGSHRRQQIVWLRSVGMSFSTIGELFSISKTMVRVIAAAEARQ